MGNREELLRGKRRPGEIYDTTSWVTAKGIRSNDGNDWDVRVGRNWVDYLEIQALRVAEEDVSMWHLMQIDISEESGPTFYQRHAGIPA